MTKGVAAFSLNETARTSISIVLSIFQFVLGNIWNISWQMNYYFQDTLNYYHYSQNIANTQFYNFSMSMSVLSRNPSKMLKHRVSVPKPRNVQ